MVANGVTVAVPDAATEPVPGAIERVVAPAVLHASVLLLPPRIVDGDAVNEEIAGSPPVQPPRKATSTLIVSFGVDSVPVEA